MLALVAATGCGTVDTTAPPIGDSPARPDWIEDGEVTRVADGDSIEVETASGILEVRLAGVNAPELDECYGDMARDHLIDAIEGEVVGLEIEGTDQFGRTLASVWLGDELVNMKLVNSGKAIALTPEGGSTHAGLLLDAEEAAHRNGTGLWGPSVCGESVPEADVRISPELSEVDPRGPDGDRIDEEVLVIVNTGSSLVDLAGWTLRDESSQNRFVFPPGSTIAPGAELVVTSGCSRQPGWCSTTPIWNNGGDMALLLDPAGNVVDRWRYP